jgi:hypothetical protein
MWPDEWWNVIGKYLDGKGYELIKVGNTPTLVSRYLGIFVTNV